MYAIIKNGAVFGGAKTLSDAQHAATAEGVTYIEAPDDFVPHEFRLTEQGLVKKTDDDIVFEEELELVRSNRKFAYPKIEEQLDLIFHGGIDAWRNVIASVKAKYPKPERGDA